jgi:RNA polymerase sigma-70 factor (ECF subfamily)
MAAFDDWLTRRSFERRTRELVSPLYRAARALTGSVTDAEDLVQDAYIKAFLAFREGEFRSVGSCRAWLFRIMVNTFRDQYRRRLRRPELELVVSEEGSEAADDLALASDAPGPDLLVEARFLREAIDAAIRALPPEIRIVATLFFIEEMKYREVAAIADCPIGTVMSRVARGRQLLQSALTAGWRPAENTAPRPVSESGG